MANMKERYSFDLNQLEDLFTEIKAHRRVEYNISMMQKVLVRMFHEDFKISIVENKSRKFFGATVFPTESLCDKVISSILQDRSKLDTVIDVWRENKEWVIELDSIAIYDSKLNANPQELVAILLHEIGHTVYSNTVPQRLFKVIRFGNMNVSAKARKMFNNKKIRLLMVPTVVEACSYKWFKFLADHEEDEADEFVVQLGYGEYLNNFLEKLLKVDGNRMLNSTERDAEKEVEVIYLWAVENSIELRARKTKLRQQLDGQINASYSAYVRNMFKGIKEKFFGKNDGPRYDQVVTTTNSLALFESCMSSAEQEVIQESMSLGRTKKVEQSEIDYIRIKSESISNQEDKIYILDLIYYHLELIRTCKELIEAGKSAKVRNSLRELESMETDLMSIRKYVLDYKIPAQTFSVFVKYPAGYEG